MHHFVLFSVVLYKGMQKVLSLTQKEMINAENTLPVFTSTYYINTAFYYIWVTFNEPFVQTFPVSMVKRRHHHRETWSACCN